MITEGRCIAAYKNTPGGTEKEYDFWQHVLGIKGCLLIYRYDYEVAQTRMLNGPASEAWVYYQGSKYPGRPWGTTPDFPIWRDTVPSGTYAQLQRRRKYENTE